MAATLGEVNPFRYRGYVYDEETGLYYLRSRYYNPVWQRFVNADICVNCYESIYQYCRNSPILFDDQDGKKSTKSVTVNSTFKQKCAEIWRSIKAKINKACSRGTISLGIGETN